MYMYIGRKSYIVDIGKKLISDIPSFYLNFRSVGLTPAGKLDSKKVRSPFPLIHGNIISKEHKKTD